MAKTEKLSASLEDYLEAILQIIIEKGTARSKDVAKRLDVAPSSVTSALRLLVKKNLVIHAPYEGIQLTARGKKVAQEVARKHKVLKKFFTEVLAVEADVADKCACRMEHAIPDEVLERFIAFIQFEERCHLGGTDWIEGTGFVCHSQSDKGNPCEECTTAGKSFKAHVQEKKS